MSQSSVPCVVYRGGTSRGLFFHESDLPADWQGRKRILLTGIDAYNSSQVDGLGGGTSHTSKAVIVSPSSLGGVDVEYTFVQVGIGEEVADSKGTCGNLMAAVGPFSVDEGLIRVDPGADYAAVNVYDTNIQKRFQLVVPLENGKAKSSGEYVMPGLARPGAGIRITVLDPGGGKTGRTLPLGPRSRLDTGRASYEVSFVDVVNPFVFVTSASLGLRGTENVDEISGQPRVLNELGMIRNEAAVAVGMAASAEEARERSPAVPKIALVAGPQTYRTTSGAVVQRDEVDILARMLSMGRVHRTFAGSGLYCVAAAALLPGTIPHGVTALSDRGPEGVVRIGHPGGVAEVRVSLAADGGDIAQVGMTRTARRIMKGDLFF